ncbi:hypothetical protein EAF04_003543 [Stromatinia cepivora]|nr:hypothetical protein EAF04_003543 [Stromatinia cepivora]
MVVNLFFIDLFWLPVDGHTKRGYYLPAIYAFLRPRLFFDVASVFFSESGHEPFAIATDPTDLRIMREDHNWQSIWQGIVITYAKRELAKGEDKLPALSRIAHEYHQRSKAAPGDYLMGLWVEDFLSHFLWFSEVWEN